MYPSRGAVRQSVVILRGSLEGRAYAKPDNTNMDTPNIEAEIMLESTLFDGPITSCTAIIEE